ncbi:serine/threonine protein kinase [Allokutzneria sp. A3M-2-11 16]|uniref:serine/threonine-protein kinase n=1 Tax=Allokutzneria sp. A3M-2-11 16 TaxID=2962043 RepID=UPI0020B8F21F|nr:serine/threonine-protein kinase [Allokutzneria sp. A3M-2-11 16]MCP3803697.1 serine/threonine protein kinase [Allokutzneria sp. A3M-2-11 16]
MNELVAGRFALVDRIGAGGAATVWRAYDQRERKYCAAKLANGQSADVLVRVVREQGVRLTHPHVLSPYTWAAEDNGVLVASELVRGGTLLALIRDHGVLPWRYAAEIVLQLLDALDHVHKAGLLHRDVKPSNVLMEATGAGAPHARLADFGIAYPADGPRLTEVGFVVGTPGYLAPEILAGHPPQPSQDLFALGVLAWQLFAGEERPERRAGTTSPPGVPGPVWTVMSRLLDTDPTRRSDAGELHAHLAHVLAGTPLELPALSPITEEPIEVYDVLGALPTGWNDPTTASALPMTKVDTRSQKPRRALLLGGIGVLLAAAATAGILLLREETPTTPNTGTPRADITVDGLCDWQDVANQETSSTGVLVRCVLQPNGDYRWKPVG